MGYIYTIVFGVRKIMKDFNNLNKLITKSTEVDNKDIDIIKSYTKTNNHFKNYGITINRNEHNFRSDSFDGDGIVYLGCSLTEGYALEEQETWPWIVSKHFDKKVWNLAKSGEGMDKMFLNSLFWIPKLKPKVVCLSIPTPGRYYVGEEWEKKYGVDSFYFYLDNENKLNKQFKYLWDNKFMYTHELKNLLSIAFICKEHNIEFIYKYSWEYDNFYNSSRAKDNEHPGVEYQQEVADWFKNEISIRNIY